MRISDWSSDVCSSDLRALCHMLDRTWMIDDERFADNVRRVANRPILDAEIGTALAGIDGERLADALKEAGIAFGFVNRVEEFSRHPQLRRVEVDTPSGPVALPAPPARWSDDRPSPGSVPALDSHGAAIRAEFS